MSNLTLSKSTNISSCLYDKCIFIIVVLFLTISSLFAWFRRVPLEFREPLVPLVKREREDPVVRSVLQVPVEPLESVYVPTSNLFRYSYNMVMDSFMYNLISVYILFKVLNYNTR